MKGGRSGQQFKPPAREERFQKPDQHREVKDYKSRGPNRPYNDGDRNRDNRRSPTVAQDDRIGTESQIVDKIGMNLISEETIV